MARTINFTTLETAIRARGEIRTAYVSQTVMGVWMNASIADLWTIINDINPDWLLADDPDTITVVSGTATYSLPADFYIARGYDVQETSSKWRSLKHFNWGERNRLQNSSAERIGVRARVMDRAWGRYLAERTTKMAG